VEQLAELFNGRYAGYRITVEGHANPVLWTMKEEREMLAPISAARARYVLERLVERGVERGRLTSAGYGGMRPLAEWPHLEQQWKNRRVEFLLTRPER